MFDLRFGCLVNEVRNKPVVNHSLRATEKRLAIDAQILGHGRVSPAISKREPSTSI
jgi:hypothetical protein